MKYDGAKPMFESHGEPSASSSPPAPDGEQMRQHLMLLFEHVSEGRIGLWFSDKKDSVWEPASDPAAIDKLVETAIFRNTQLANCYVNIAVRKGEGEIDRGKKEDCITGVAWVADVDWGDGVNGHKVTDKNRHKLCRNVEAARAVIDRHPLPPTMVLESGRGVQAFWVTAEPVPLDEFGGSLTTWRTWWKAQPEADKVNDVPRMMRLAGSINWSTETTATITDLNTRYTYDPVDIIEGTPYLEPKVDAFTGSDFGGRSTGGARKQADPLAGPRSWLNAQLVMFFRTLIADGWIEDGVTEHVNGEGETYKVASLIRPGKLQEKGNNGLPSATFNYNELGCLHNFSENSAVKQRDIDQVFEAYFDESGKVVTPGVIDGKVTGLSCENDDGEKAGRSFNHFEYLRAVHCDGDEATTHKLAEKLCAEGATPDEKEAHAQANQERAQATAEAKASAAGKVTVDYKIGAEDLAIAALHNALNGGGGCIGLYRSGDGELIDQRMKMVADHMAIAPLASLVHYTKPKDKVRVTAMVPSDLRRAVLAKPFDGPPELLGLAFTPVVRPDGTFMAKTGYDPVTKLYVSLDGELIVPDRPALGDAISAWEKLKPILVSYIFRNTEGGATAADNYAFAASMIFACTAKGLADGPLPIFGLNSNSPSSGKSEYMGAMSELMGRSV